MADSSVNVAIKKPVTRDSGIEVSNLTMAVAEYDSIQSRLPKAEGDGWLLQRLNKKSILIRQQYLHNREAF